MGSALKTLRLSSNADDICRAAATLRAGGLVAMPTETVYGLAANALNAAAVERIFAAKGRPHWDPLIVHIANPSMLSELCEPLSVQAERLIAELWPGPLTLLLPRLPTVPDAVTAGRTLVGVRMPSHPVARALIEAAGFPLAAPSANLFGHISPTTADHVLADLDGRIEAVIDAGPCSVGIESTVVDVSTLPLRIYRQGGTDAATVERVAGVPVCVHEAAARDGAAPASLPSPGVGIRHYAPRARLILVASEQELQESLAIAHARSTAVLLPQDWSLREFSGTVERWPETRDIHAQARTLYSSLRSADRPGIQTIYAPLPAATDGIAGAIRDRLLKASRSR